MKRARWTPPILLALITASLATATCYAADKGADVFDVLAVWEQGGFRGANVMLNTPPEDLRVLRSWGANLEEIAVSDVYEPNPPYSFQPLALEKVDKLVAGAEAAGLFIVLTCRTGPGREDFNRSYEIWREAEAQEAYARMWQHLASHYRGRESIVGYDLMCEPHPDDEADKPLGDWNALAKKVTEAIRQVDPDTPILVNSSGWGYPQLFDFLEPTGDPRTVYVVHFYSPKRYTHQRRRRPIPYPGVVPAHVEPEQYWDKTTIEKTLAAVRSFQKRHSVPIFAGEFGCTRWAPGAVEYLRDQMDLYEQWNWSWAYWAFREWDAMDIEKKPEAADRERYEDTPLLRLFRSYFARDTAFPKPRPALPSGNPHS